MDTLIELAGMILHIDQSLGLVVDRYGVWVYGMLFLIIFAETGLVVFPFLPGDSLLFIAGAFCAAGTMDLLPLNVLLLVAAVLGNTLNYWIGKRVGAKIWEMNPRWIDHNALRKTHDFYERHGGKTIVLARFIPVIRTFAPFVGGVSDIPHGRFQLYSVGGALLWIVGLSVAGYFFGNQPFIKQYLNVIVLAGIASAAVPVALGALWRLFKRRR
ncbi:MAG: VTT domain-containing protein [Candidatus Protistobacter heckmanni]|nr:VTT domain-containing protein [Candidatus Protistobacter heckmanni]